MTWKHIGTLSQRLAARLVAQREAQIFAGDKNGGRVGAHTLDDATARCPLGEERDLKGSRAGGFENGTRAGKSNEAGVKIASNPARREGGQQSPAHGRLPLFIPGE